MITVLGNKPSHQPVVSPIPAPALLFIYLAGSFILSGGRAGGEEPATQEVWQLRQLHFVNINMLLVALDPSIAWSVLSDCPSLTGGTYYA